MSDLSVLLQARKEIKQDIKTELDLPKWSQHRVKSLCKRLDEINEDICCLVESGTEGELTLC